MIHDLLTFEAYFQSLKTANLGIETVIVGGYSDILALQNATIRYPLLFVERPSEKLNQDDTSQFQTRLVMLTNDSRTTSEQYRINLNAMRKKLIQVLKIMEADSPKKFVFNRRNVTLDYKEAMTGDLLHGAFTEIELQGVRICA